MGTYLPHDIRGLFSVQIGANCGLNVRKCAVGGDPVFEYITHCQWRGIAIEPAYATFKALCRNYAHLPNVQPRRGAVVSHELAVKPVFMTRTSSETNAAGAAGAERTPALSLESLWDQEVRHITAVVHVLVIDAEGSEPSILCCEIPSPKPLMILFEHAHLSEPEGVKIAVNLERQGYVHVADLRHQTKRGRKMQPQDRLYGLR